MELDNAFAKVFQAFMATPNAKSQLSLDKPIPPGFLLKYPTVAKEIFSNEPGCTVNYRAILEKIKVLEPHLKVTSSGPALMEYFAGLRKKRNKWAVAFANYQSHMIMTFLLEQKLYGRPLNASQRAAFPDGPRAVLSESLAAAWQELFDTKSTREFVQYVRILEECIKQHKIYLQRKAAAEKQRQALAKKKRQAEARKAKKAALAASTMSQQPKIAQTTFNPDLPDFAQFISSFASPAPPAAAVPSKKKPQKVTTNTGKATKATSPTDAIVGNKSANRNVGSAAAAEAQTNNMAATSTNMTTLTPMNSVAQTSLGVIAPTPANLVAQNSMKWMGQTPAVRIDKPTSSKITHIVRDPGTIEEWMMEEPLFPNFVRQYGYPPPNCFVGPLAGSHPEHKVYIEHQPKYSPEELEKYKQMGTSPPPARYVELWEGKITLQTPDTWHLHDTTNSHGDPTACTVTPANHEVSDKEVEPLGLGHPSPPSDSELASNSITPSSNNCTEQTLAEAAPAEFMSFEEFTERFNNGDLPEEFPMYDPVLDSPFEPNLNSGLNPALDPALGPNLNANLDLSLDPTVGPVNQPQDVGMDMGSQGWDGETALPPLGSTSVMDGYEEGFFFNELFGRG